MSTPPQTAPPPPRPRRRLALRVALIIAAGVVLLGVGSAARFRHQPYQIPKDLRAPAAPANAALRVRYLGVTSYEISDGATVIITDPAFSRPTLWALQTGPLAPDEALSRRLVPRADFILINHAHFDHIVDMPEIARRTGAQVVGPLSAINLARARGIPEAQLRQVMGGETLTLGTFQVQVARSQHSAIGPVAEPMHGVIAPDVGPLWWWQYLEDLSLCYRLEAAGASLWFHPTSTFRAGELGGRPASTLIVGVNGKPLSAENARAILDEARPSRIIPTHYDNFLQPYQLGIALFPGLDLEAARAALLAPDPNRPLIILDYEETLSLPPDSPR